MTGGSGEDPAGQHSRDTPGPATPDVLDGTGALTPGVLGGDVLSGGTEPLRPPRRTPRAPRPPGTWPFARAPWAWALAGALVASAGWAAGGTLAERAHHHGPDLHGYRIVGSPCIGSALKPLFDATPADGFSPWPANESTGPALDRVDCTAVSTTDPEAKHAQFEYLATVSVELHKKTDPGPEFHDERALDWQTVQRADTVTTVPGLGDQAYLLTVIPSQIQLKVLQGGAVIVVGLTIQRTEPDDGDPTVTYDTTPYSQPDIDRYRPALISTVRSVMTKLKMPEL
jgi:hypothetical protein